MFIKNILSSNLLAPSLRLLENKAQPCISSILSRQLNILNIDRPKPGTGRQYKFQTQYPKDGKYTIDLLPNIRLDGRDPETGRKIVRTYKKGRNAMYRWIDFNRRGPTEQDCYLEEKIIEIQYDPNREPFIALVGSGSHLRYILATSTMRRGDVIRSSNFIPEIPGHGKPGDSYAIGALANGTEVCHVEQLPGEDAFYHKREGTFGVIKRRLGDGRVVMTVKATQEVALDPNCNAVVGRISNEDADKVFIGSAMRLRWLGYGPRSGLEQRKMGKHGRKLKRPEPLLIPEPPKAELRYNTLSSMTEGPKRRCISKTDVRRRK